MDWDESRQAAGTGDVVVGEKLDRHSIDDLNARIKTLEAEIARSREEIAKKRAHSEQAASIFKS